jgi:hypothetical protein
VSYLTYPNPSATPGTKRTAMASTDFKIHHFNADRFLHPEGLQKNSAESPASIVTRHPRVSDKLSDIINCTTRKPK